jgi:two-component system, response regulator PdtaR
LEPSDESKPVVILIVEDEMIVRMSTTDILQDAGYLVLEARDGVEAIAMLELRDDVAALFTDVTMPNMCSSWNLIGQLASGGWSVSPV